MSMDRKKMETAGRIRQIREEQKLTQAEMAEASGLSLENLKKIEDGGNAMSTASLRKVQKTLGVSFDFLLEGEKLPLHQLEQEMNACTYEERIYLLLKLFKSITRTEYTELEIGELLGLSEKWE